MIDTIKLLIRMINPLVLEGSLFQPTLNELVNSSKYGKAVLNPSPMYAKQGIYMPRLTVYKRPSGSGPDYQLAVEFSAPKVIYNNNVDELEEKDFETLLEALQSKLYELTRHRFFRQELAHADVGAWHPSKNIVFLDYTACQTVLNTISKLDISRVYDLQKTDFRDGHVVHIHSNSLDVAFYDKKADQRKTKLSEKRAFEKDTLVQASLFDELEKVKPLEILRYEVRLNGRAAIKRAYPELEKWTLEALFKKSLCQNVLLKHWYKITESADLLSLDVNKPYELLRNYLEDNPKNGPQASMAGVLGLLVCSQVGTSSLRNVLESRFGPHVWGRIKPLLKSPQPHGFTYFQHVEETLVLFAPVRLSEFVADISQH